MADTTNIKVLADRQDIVAVADAIRVKTGKIDSLTLNQMATEIESIPTGIQLPTLTNPGSASDLLSGKELINQDGNKITGTISTKTSSDLTSSGATVTVPAGYYASSASKSVSTATQATPNISVNSSGLITASVTQSAGYVSSGTKSSTKQLTTKSAATITPRTSDQTIASGTYLTGAQTIKGDANLIADNIKSGTKIFGITGSYEGNTPNLQSKSVTYTANGAATITPDSGYDGLSSVDVTVDVSGGGSSGGGYLEALSLSGISTTIILRDVSCVSCAFNNGYYEFGNSNATFEYCDFENSEVRCTQELYDAIVNGENNSYSTSSFIIIS